MENVIDKETKNRMNRAWALDKLRQREADKYPNLSISIWHTGNIYDINYMNELKNCLTIHLDPELQYKESDYTENRYDVECPKRDASKERLPEDLKPIYDKYIRTINTQRLTQEREDTYER